MPHRADRAHDRSRWALPLATVLATALALASSQPTAAGAQEGDAVPPEDPVQAAVDLGNELLGEGRDREAVRTFERADRIAGGSSPHALIGLTLALNRVSAWADAERAARDAIEVAGDDLYLRTSARNALALVLLSSPHSDDAELAEAEGIIRASLAEAGEQYPLFALRLGETLMRRGKDLEAIPYLEDYLEAQPTGASADYARSLIADPRRAREAIVPAFSMVTLDGRYLTPEDFAGRAVLIDFWGTWCAPCRQATPDLRRLAKRLSDKPFELVGVSNDVSREVLERYIEEHEVGWTQVWDQSGDLRRAFRVRSYPTYVLVDHEGRVVHRASGWGFSAQRDLAREIRAAVKAARKAAEGEDG